jgi:putative transposase
MPAKNRIKPYLEGGYYHIYNRGVEKRLIFLDKQDYAVFLNYLKEYLLPKDETALTQILSDPSTSTKQKDKALKLLRLNNFAGEITMIAYCLMPNHFHFFLKQKSAYSVDRFMQSLATRYTMYFNRKHKRVGFLYQDTYKGLLIVNEIQFIYLSKYIHKQALKLHGSSLKEQQPCSFADYTGIKNTQWVQPEEVLACFSKSNPILSYNNFVLGEDNGYEIIQNIILDEDLA